jgi:hypothetical protein
MHSVRGFAGFRQLQALVLVSACAMAGCRSTQDVSREPPEAADWTCPPEVDQQIHLRTSVVPRPLSPDMMISEGSIAVHHALARRVLVSIEPTPEIAGSKLLSSSLSIAVFGGTLRSWIDGSGSPARTEPRAIEIDRSTYHVNPFLTERSVGPQSRSVDLVVMPGGEPLDSLQVSVGSLWNADHSPVKPEAVGLTVEPIRYPTTYSRVDANVTVEIVGLPAGSHRTGWKCSVERRATLVDREAVRPPSWDIGMPDPEGGRRKRWLVFNSNASGPFRVIFASPRVADNFLAWLRKVQVAHLGQYDLGVFRPVRPADAEDLFISRDRDIMASFESLALKDLANLQVGPLDEP